VGVQWPASAAPSGRVARFLQQECAGYESCEAQVRLFRRVELRIWNHLS
jgi:hypothetical protein